MMRLNPILGVHVLAMLLCGSAAGACRAGQAEAGEAKIEGRSYDLSEAVR